MEPKKGPVAIFVPPTLVGNWVEEWEKVIDPADSQLRMELFVGHGMSGLGDRKLGPRHWKLFQWENGQAREGQERFVVVTTSQSYDNHVKAILQTDITPPKAKRARKEPQKVFQLRVAWGRAIRDEFHLEKNMAAATPTLFRSLKGDPYRWMMSGTPFETSPADLAGYLASLESPQWQNDPKLVNCTAAKVMELGRRFASLIKSGDTGSFPAIAKEFREGVLEQIMIRRLTTDKWFNHPIVNLPPMDEKDLYCESNKRYSHRLHDMEREVRNQVIRELERKRQEWIQKGKQGNEPRVNSRMYFTYASRLRLVASFPALSELLESGEVDLTGKQLVHKGWVYSETSPYHKHLDELIRSSGKISLIEEILDEQCLDYMGRPAKLLIMSSFPVACFILYLVSVFTFANMRALHHYQHFVLTQICSGCVIGRAEGSL